MSKRILIVGGGFGQLPAINAAKNMGLMTIVVDKNPKAVGALLADVFYEVDIIDKEGVLKVAKENNVSGVMTMQSDLPVPTIGFINDTLGLKGVSFEVANYCSNKMETRKRLKNKSSAQPFFEIISTIKEAKEAALKVGYPCVVKAPDSSGSRGITKVNSEHEIENAYHEAFKYTRETSILVEEFIEGLEFGAQTFSVNGECKLVLLHGDTISKPPYMIPVGHSFPFNLLNSKEQEVAINDIKAAVDELGIQDGPANVDLILDKKTNRVKIIEIGARIGATCLPELVYYHTGIDWVQQTILNAIGEQTDLEVKYEKPVAALIIESPKDGIYRGYELSDEIKRDVLEFEITVKEGEEVNILRKGTDRIGKILTYGDTVEEAEKLVEYFRNATIINVK